MWEAVDGNGHSVRRLPKILLACPLNLEMREHAVSETPMIPDLIQDSDLVVLQPGDKYAFPEIDDPSFSLKFLKRGTYRFTLKYAFEPSHYRLSIGSKKDALEKAVPLHLSSNTLAVTLY